MVATDIYRKNTHTGQYSHFSSFDPFPAQNCTGKLCSTGLLKFAVRKHFSTIKLLKSNPAFMSWNGYPNGVRNVLIKKLKTK